MSRVLGGRAAPSPARPTPRTPPGARVASAVLAAVATLVGPTLAGCSSSPLQVAGSQASQQFTPVPGRTPSRASTPSASASVNLRTVRYAKLVAADRRIPADLRQDAAGCGGPCTVDPPDLATITGLGQVAIATVEGSGGPDGTVVYAAVAGAPTLVFAHYGPEGWVEVKNGNLVMSRRMYTSDDAEATPSGPLEVSTYRWNGSRFVLQSRTGGGAQYTPYMPNDQVVIP